MTMIVGSFLRWGYKPLPSAVRMTFVMRSVTIGSISKLKIAYLRSIIPS